MKTLTGVLVLTLTFMLGAFNEGALAQSTKAAPVVENCDRIQDKGKQQACFNELSKQQMTKFAPLQQQEAKERTAKTQLAKKTQQDVLAGRIRTNGNGLVCGDGMDLGMGPIGWFYVWCCNGSGCSGSWL
ncbi:MAG: hypothetical protein FD144_3093 [Rhodospirillaceae bacterium]|nr:MAG: hypothetical protein FD144_3093 [Rhodospirillaceae bacterium]